MHKSNQTGFEEAEKLIPSHIEQIRLVLENKYRLNIPSECDQFIARCLRTKDGDVENAIKLIRAFHSAIANLKYWDVKCIPSLFQHYYKTGVIEPLLNPDKYGRRILIIRTGLWDIQNISFDQVAAVLWMIAQYGLSELLEVQRKGYALIGDFSEFTWHHAWAVNQFRLLTLVRWIQSGVGGRFKAVHIIHHPKAVDHLFRVIRPFMSEKLKNRVIFHRSVESLLKDVGAENLPKVFGGTLKDMMDTGFPSK